MGLVQPKIGRRVRQIVDGAAVDLSESVELTPLGSQWAECILAIERIERPQADRGKARDDA